MSIVLPAENGTMARIGRDGQAWAPARRGSAGVASAAAAEIRIGGASSWIVSPVRVRVSWPTDVVAAGANVGKSTTAGCSLR